MISVRASLGDWLCSEMAWRATELKKTAIPVLAGMAGSQGGTHRMVRAARIRLQGKQMNAVRQFPKWVTAAPVQSRGGSSRRMIVTGRLSWGQANVPITCLLVRRLRSPVAER